MLTEGIFGAMPTTNGRAPTTPASSYWPPVRVARPQPDLSGPPCPNPLLKSALSGCVIAQPLGKRGILKIPFLVFLGDPGGSTVISRLLWCLSGVCVCVCVFGSLLQRPWIRIRTPRFHGDQSEFQLRLCSEAQGCILEACHSPSVAESRARAMVLSPPTQQPSSPPHRAKEKKGAFSLHSDD
jgi:hypothetical protein